jgi:omega-amidase
MSKKNISLNIAVIQTKLVWENKEQNILNFEKHFSKIKNADIVVLPETFSTGFSMESKSLAEPMNGKTVTWMKKYSKKMKSVICGSLIIEENKKQYNRFIWAMPNGEVYSYDKRHLFSPGTEDKHYTQGKDKVIINYKGWNICPLICYDLRFPVWSKNVNNQYDVLIYVANWPSPRNFAWQQLLIARAIENQSYVVGVNRVGFDAKGINHNGSSTVIDYLGKQLLKGPDDKVWIKQVKIEKKPLEDFRIKLPFAKDADLFTIN